MFSWANVNSTLASLRAVAGNPLTHASLVNLTRFRATISLRLNISRSIDDAVRALLDPIQPLEAVDASTAVDQRVPSRFNRPPLELLRRWPWCCGARRRRRRGRRFGFFAVAPVGLVAVAGPAVALFGHMLFFCAARNRRR